MEDKIAKQILTAFSDVRLNTSHVAWMVKLHTNKHIDEKLKEFFYFYHTFRKQDTEEADRAWIGEKILDEMKHPEYENMSSPPPPGTRIVFAEDL
jgi:hypothetical protein